MSLSQDTIARLFEEQKIIDCKQAGFNYASFKPRTSKQVVDKLKILGFADEQIFPTINFLIDFDLIDDTRFSENYIDNKLRTKSIGVNKIRIELLKKGIKHDLIDAAIERKYPHHQTYDLALAAANKKIIQIKRKEENKQKPALINFLISQGFDWETIRAVAAEIFKLK